MFSATTRLLPSSVSGVLVLDMSKIVTYGYWYDYVKPTNGKMAKLCYIDMDSFIVHEKSEDIYANLAGDVEKRLDTSNSEVRRPLPIRKNTAQNMKFSIKDFFSKCDQIRRFLRIWSHLLKKSLMENFMFCAVCWPT